MNLGPWRARLAVGLFLGVLIASSAVPETAFAQKRKTVRESVLEDRYTWGDYGLYFAYHQPADWQFEVHAESAYPFGLKVRFKLGDHPLLQRVRVEGDISYFRRSDDPLSAISVFQTPGFDALWVAATAQYLLPPLQVFQGYVGGGPIFASMANDFFIFRPDVAEVDPTNADRFALANWSKSDLGWQVVVGVDVPLGFRAFPFLEYRQVFGELSLTDRDVKIGSLSLASINLSVEDVTTLPDDLASNEPGRPYEPQFDWSGPEVLVGLKILF